ncbi:MAG: 3-deoxy-D-manno-octulosonic acid transferase [Cyclobacteriaceae bacterium]|nr:3-deoxy-D-manno-octulosonic acid transferase [Cyclobacteriaceae bacterium]
MGRLIYDLSIALYRLAVFLASPWNKKAGLMYNGRKGLKKEIASRFAENDRPVAWFHCASLGEFEQGRPLIEAFINEYPEYRIVLTFFSPSGYEVRKNYPGADDILYLPWDSPRNAQFFIRKIKPRIAFFVKYEYWYHYLKELNSTGATVFSVSTILRADQLFFKPYGRFYKKLLFRFTYFFVQNKSSLELLKKAGILQARLSGDTRFDRVLEIVNHQKEIPIAAAFKNGEALMVIGSSWPSDMQVLLPFIQKHIDTLKFIIAPHEISEKSIGSLEKDLGKLCIRYSKANELNIADYRILLIDNIGMLSSLYQYGEMAYIGGAFRKALHNTLEAATYGIPVIFGSDPSNAKFAEAGDLVNMGAAFEVSNSFDLEKTVLHLLKDEQNRKSAGSLGAAYVKDRSGATSMIMQNVHNHLKNV